MKTQLRGTAMLLLTAMIWGGAFVAQTVGMDYIGSFTFQVFCKAVGFLALIPVVLFSDRGKPKMTRKEWKRLLLCGLGCGCFLFIATILQQFGLALGTTAGKSGFITALYIVLVPILGSLLGKKAAPSVWLATVIALIGLCLLCLDSSFTIGVGELLTLICSLFFAGHIIFIDRVCVDVDGIKLSALQCAVSSLLSIPGMLLTETVSFPALSEAWVTILYAGAFSGGIAYTLQILAQKITDPTVASITMSLESVFALLFGWLLLRQGLQPKEWAGCILMFAAVILAQLPSKKARIAKY